MSEARFWSNAPTVRTIVPLGTLEEGVDYLVEEKSSAFKGTDGGIVRTYKWMKVIYADAPADFVFKCAECDYMNEASQNLRTHQVVHKKGKDVNADIRLKATAFDLIPEGKLKTALLDKARKGVNG